MAFAVNFLTTREKPKNKKPKNKAKQGFAVDKRGQIRETNSFHYCLLADICTFPSQEV